MKTETNTKNEKPSPTNSGGGAILQRLVSPVYVYSDCMKSLTEPINIKCLNHLHASTQGKALEDAGWIHTATLEPSAWIEHLCNGKEPSQEMIRSLQEG